MTAEVHLDTIARQVVTNSTSDPLELVIEPWGVSLFMPAGNRWIVEAKSDRPGTLEMLAGGGVVEVYAWPGATASVYDATGLILDLPIRAPEIPAGHDTRSFLEMVLGRHHSNADCTP